MTWSNALQLSPVAEETDAGSVPVPLRPKSVEETWGERLRPGERDSGPAFGCDGTCSV